MSIRRVNVVFLLLSFFMLEACSFRAITVRALPDPSPAVFVDSCLQHQSCPGRISKIALSRGNKKEDFIDISLFASDVTGPGSVLRVGASFGLTFEGNIIDCIVLSAYKLKAPEDRQIVAEATALRRESRQLYPGQIRMTPAEFLRFERLDGIPDQYSTLRDMEIDVENATVIIESVDPKVLLSAISISKPFFDERCRRLIKSS